MEVRLGPVECQTLILAALQIEGKALARAMELTRIDALTWRAGAVELRVIGLRGSRMPADLPGASRVILAGLGGGLDPALRAGDVVVDAVPGLARLPAGVRAGRIHTAGEVVCTPAEKAALFAVTGAPVVDMEGAAVRRALAGRPFIHVRAILDDAACALPEYLGDMADHLGRPKVWKVAGRILRGPGAIKELARLGRESARALDGLGRAVAAIIGNA